MAIKPTEFHKKVRKPLPEYEVITDKDEEKLASAACCICDGPGSLCDPESPSTTGQFTTAAAAQVFAFWTEGR